MVAVGVHTIDLTILEKDRTIREMACTLIGGSISVAPATSRVMTRYRVLSCVRLCAKPREPFKLTCLVKPNIYTNHNRSVTIVNPRSSSHRYA